MRTCCFIFLLLLSPLGHAKQIVDIVNRQVEVPDNPQRIIIGESRMIYTLALVEEGNPARRVVGWPGDLMRLDKQTWKRYSTAFPEMKTIPIIGNSNFSQISVEKVISLKPDLVILPVYAKKQNDHDQFEMQLVQANIPVVYVDFRVKQLTNTLPSMRILGEVLNQQDKAERFIRFYQRHIDFIRERLATVQQPKPTVMLQLHLGRKDECCTTVAQGNLADLIAFAGGNNIASGRFPGVFGQISAEAVIDANPDVYLATGMAGPQDPNLPQLGPEVSEKEARESFARSLSSEPIISRLTAIKQGRAFGIWHNFYMSPWHLLDVEIFAKVFYPELFSDLDPQKTLEEMSREFLPVTLEGTYWIPVK
ncbi:ABC transporter substrate-binding protein [Brenneria rubrifaciens]|uniref:Fe/B12 periplasmic-binding domain-containing protein n=1 Tax=Brenneria rubrifaciens TaxID=55213 RepID=A0A4P8QUY6_9GAMM|nr:ABC transporter substrate-binding protein [Brenneria rubrifaciens]QCR07955.1 hypothetical protein EH207_05115 [Brenneria rubrifaciens]